MSCGAGRRHSRARAGAPEPAVPRAAGRRPARAGSGCPTAELTAVVEIDPDAAPADEPAIEDEASGALYQGGGGIGEADLPAEPEELPFVLARGPRTVVIAGADAGPDAETLAHAGGWPLIAEIVSGARFGRNLVHGYRRAARRPAARRPHRARGRARASRPSAVSPPRCCPTRASRSLAVRGPGEPLNLNGATTAVDAVARRAGRARSRVARCVAAAPRARHPSISRRPHPMPTGCRRPFRRSGSARSRAELAAVRAPLDRAALVDAVWRATWPHDRLVFGSSRLVRVADDVLGGKKVPVHANRGLAGHRRHDRHRDRHRARLPGRRRARASPACCSATSRCCTTSARCCCRRARTSRASRSSSATTAAARSSTASRWRRSPPAEAMDRVLYTPQAARLEHLALAYGWEYQRVTTRAALDQALTSPVGGRQLIEVPLSR